MDKIINQKIMMDLSREGHMSPMAGESEEAAKRIEEANVNMAGKGNEDVEKFVADQAKNLENLTPEEKDRIMGIEKGSETNH